MNVTIIGCGNAGLIHAGKLVEQGHKVTLLKTSNYRNQHFRNMVNDGGYFLRNGYDSETHCVEIRPALITCDAKTAVASADVIVIMVVTTAHESVAKMIADYVRDGQIICICPAYMGSLVFKQYISKDVTYCEMETTSYNGRIRGNVVDVTFHNVRNAVSVLPVSRASEASKVISELFGDVCVTRKNILESALYNPNMIEHPVGILLSASRIENSKRDFNMYRESFTPSVIRVINEFDKTKCNVLEQFGCTPISHADVDRWRYGTGDNVTYEESFMHFAEFANNGPYSVQNRYILEDVPMGVGLLSSLAEVVSVDHSLQDGIISIASALTGENLKQKSRTIQCLIKSAGKNIVKNDVLRAIEG